MDEDTANKKPRYIHLVFARETYFFKTINLISGMHVIPKISYITDLIFFLFHNIFDNNDLKKEKMGEIVFLVFITLVKKKY